MEDRLLNAYLAGTIEEDPFKAKSAELRAEQLRVQEANERLGTLDSDQGEAALAVFDWCQNAYTVWRGSNMAQKREILESVSLNRTLSAATLDVTKRKPFDLLAEGPFSKTSRGERIRTSDLLNPIPSIEGATHLCKPRHMKMFG
jgi:hypothetical protein